MRELPPSEAWLGMFGASEQRLESFCRGDEITEAKLGIAVYRERARASRGWRFFAEVMKSQKQNSELPFIASEQERAEAGEFLRR